MNRCDISMNRAMSREEISEIFGVEWIDSDHGVFKVKSRLKEAEILDCAIYETTTPLRLLVNDLKRAAVVRAKFGLLGRLLYKQCYKEKPPNIAFAISPLYFKNVKFHWGGLWFEGDIATKFSNSSQPAMQGIVYVRRRESCPEDESAYKWEEVKGSADLLPDWLNKFWEDTTSKFISQLKQHVDKYVKVNDFVEVSGYWKTDPLSLDTFKTMWTIFTSGSIVTRHGFDVTVKYNFNGEQIKTFHVDTRVRLPIQGDVSWFNW